MIRTSRYLLWTLAVLAHGLAQAQTIEFGNISVVQNDAGNAATSVSLTKAAGSSDAFSIIGGNRGDYEVSFGTANDIGNGVMISSISQNGRDNNAAGDTIGLFYGSSAVERGVTGNLTKYYIPLFRCGVGDEINMNVTCAYFPFSQWLGAVARNAAGTNGGATDEIIGNPAIRLGTEFISDTGGIFRLDLTGVSASSSQSGILLVSHAKNEDNYALSRANADGTFTLWVHDNGANGASYEQDPIAFVYLPVSAVNTNGIVAMGRINSDATSALAGGTYTMTKGPTGQWYLTIPGQTNTTGVLVISPEGGGTNTSDNVVSFQWEDAAGRWVIESRDLSGAVNNPTLQDGANAAEDVFSFVFLRTANLAPSVAITAPTSGSAIAPAALSFEINATDADGSITEVALLRNGVVVETDSSAPFTFDEVALPAGAYSYVARATDNGGATAVSTPVTILVTFDPNQIPANTALQFDGENDYVTMGAALELGAGGPPSNGLTLECWFFKTGDGRTSSSGSGGISGVPLFGKGRGESDGTNVDCNYFFGINAAGRLVADFEAYPAAGISSGQNYPITATNTPITNDVWHHAAVTYDGNTQTWRMYLDGAEVGTAPAAPGALPRYDSIQHFGIGAAFNSSGVAEGAFEGVMDEVRIWNVARTGAEIAGAFSQEVGAAPGLIGRFGLNEGTGLSTSSSAGATSGTLTNGPAWVAGAPFTVANTSPTVALTAPVDNANSFMPFAVNFAADAADADGTVAKVEFLVNGVEVGEDVSSPFTFAWNPPAPGTYTVRARALDNLSAGALSAPATLNILPNNNQPPVVTLTSPADEAVLSGDASTLMASLNDPEGDPMTVTFYGRVATPAAPGPDFTLVAIPDTQYYSEGAANHATTVSQAQLVGIFSEQTQWVLEQKTARNIAFVSHMGDIVEHGQNGGDDIEWQRASAAMGILENPIAAMRSYGIPFGAAPGNHDQTPIGNADGSTVFYNQFFGVNRFAGRDYYGGNFGVTNDNNYQLFSASGLDFIAIHFEYDTTPDQAVLDWADALLKAHPHRRAIITSHWIVGAGMPAAFSTQGQTIYNELKDNPNLFLMLCGHIHAEGRRSDTFEGRTVHSILQDYQGAINGGNGFLRIYTFSPANNKITVESFSPRLGRAVNASDGIPSWTAAFEIPYEMQAPVADWVPLGTVNVAASGTSASLLWTGLQAGTRYEWYAAAADGVNVAGSAPRQFQVAAGMPPTVALTSPATGASFSTPVSIPITATASDSDGTIAKVEFFSGGTRIGEDLVAPYEMTWTGVAPGTYTLSAVATDNSGLTALSGGATITVVFGDFPPTVALTAPLDGALLAAPASVTLMADAADTEGVVTKVEFFSNGVLVGEDLVAPYTFELSALSAGAYEITARATDGMAQTTTSAPIQIAVFTEAAAPNPANVSVGLFGSPSWTVRQTSPEPHQFDLPGTDVGDLELRVNGSSVVFASGIVLTANWDDPTEVGINSRDNISQAYANASGNVFVSVLDNSNNNAAGANPSTSEQTSGTAAAFLPYADGWTGASVNSDAAILSGNLPAGVTVVKEGGAGTYRIVGLAVTGNLLAFTNGDSGTLADNVCSVRVVNNQWIIDTRDNAGGTQDNQFSFVYLPPSTPGVLAGKISTTGTVSNTNLMLASFGANVSVSASGYDVTFGDGSVINPTTAALFVVGDSTTGAGSSTAADNLVSWSASGNAFRIFTQDLPGIDDTFEAIPVRFVAIPFSADAFRPTVEIVATDAAAGEFGPDQVIQFAITRTGDVSTALEVSLTTSGSAGGADYSGFQTTVVIPALATSVNLPLTVLPDALAEGNEIVTLSIATSPAYVIGASASANATIADRPAQAWAAQNIADPARRGPLDDADNDGNENVVEYFMGTLPGDNNNAANSHVAVIGNTAVMTFVRALNRPDVTGIVEWSRDLATWFRTGQSDGTFTVDITESVISATTDQETIEATATPTSGLLPADLFFRLHITQ